MVKVKLVLLTALALLAAGSVTAASASATDHYLLCVEAEEPGHGTYANHECKLQGGSKDWEKEVLRSGSSYELGAEGGPSKLETGKFTIACPDDRTEFGHLKGAGTSDYDIEFLSCEVKGKSGCSVSKYELQLEGVLDGVLIEEGGKTTTNIELTLLSGSEATLSGSGCSVKGTYKFKGKQTCGMPSLKEMALVHEMICKPTGTEIEVEGGEKGVKFTDTEEVHVFKLFWGAEA